MSYYAWREPGRWGFWFRVLGYGLSVSNSRPLFSERYGYRKCVRVLGVKLELLTPRPTA